MKQFSVIVISALILSVGGVLILNEVGAQVDCTPANEEAVCGDPAETGLRCVESRCNVPPPIWNAQVFGEAQDAEIFLQGTGIDTSLRVGDVRLGLGNQLNNLTAGEVAVNFNSSGRGFTVYDGATNDWFRINNAGLVRVARGLSIGGDAPDAGDGDLEIAGNINGINFDNVVNEIIAGDGLTLGPPGNTTHRRTLSLLQDCDDGQVLQWDDDAGDWDCGTIAGGGGDGGEPLFIGWRDSDTPALEGLLQVGGFQLVGDIADGSVLTADDAGVGTWQPLPPGVLPGGVLGQTLRHDGNGWISNDLLYNNGTNIGIRTDDPQFGLDVQGAGVQGQIRAQSGFCIANDCINAWVDVGGGGGGGGVGGAGAADKLAFWTDANTLDHNDNLHWDDADRELGIGTADPEFTLDASGDRIIIRNPDGNAEFDLQSRDPSLPDGVEPQHWGLYVEENSRDLRFWYGADRFFFSSTGDFVAANSINANGCFGPVFVGLTGAVNGNQGGYQAADAICAGAFVNSHVCTVAEIFNSKSCDAAIFVAQVTGSGWVLSGPPGFTTNANDCIGRTSANVDDLGSFWRFNNQGGQGWLSPCSANTRGLACCR